MYITPDAAAQFDRDGFLLVDGLFSPREVQILLHDVEHGARVAGTTSGLADTSGRSAKLAIWHELGDDVWAAASTCPRIVNNARTLLREEIAFFHGKVMLKEAHAGGAWEWHQDYGYWYQQGYVFPRLISAFVALDAATMENGCLQVLKGSHLLGRLEHETVGAQAGAAVQRIRQLENQFERVQCVMSPGSVLFFHCNLLHSSAPNNSDHHRRSFIMCYNALTNPQLGERQTSEKRPCPVAPDDVILQHAA